ncbi:YqxA family protein [Bacillus marasmi]|uniref:YqxA family protein n=1 Tax=Bacillus marasmi TaxID=1926279 RepID=UPI0011C78FA6|nr:YqxA family protein [Bacillus marasmi]
MKLFMLKSFILASIMFVCVLFGMQQANDGIHRMKGYDDSDFGRAISFSENEKGNIEASFLGQDVDSHDFTKKKEEIEEMNAYNIFSSAGKNITKGIEELTGKTLDYFAKKISE